VSPAVSVDRFDGICCWIFSLDFFCFCVLVSLGLQPIFQSRTSVLGVTKCDRKGKNPGKPKQNNARRECYRAYIRPTNCLVPLPEALLWLPLPFPGEIVTADVSRCGNEGAGEVCGGGGWSIKNTRNKEREL